MTRLQTAGRAAATIMIGTALISGAVAAQSGGTDTPRGLDFRLPPADDGRDSNVQGPSDNGLPPRQETPKSVPKAATPAPSVTPPKLVPTVTAPKAAPKAAPSTAPSTAPKAAAPAAPRPAPTATAPVAAPVPTAAPQTEPPVVSDQVDPAAVPPILDGVEPSADVLPEENPAFLPSETEADAAADSAAEASDTQSPWWAWLVAAAIALGLAVLYWRKQTAIRPEDYLDDVPATPVKPAPPAVPPAPAPAPAPKSAAPPLRAAPRPAPAQPSAAAPTIPAPLPAQAPRELPRAVEQAVPRTLAPQPSPQLQPSPSPQPVPSVQPQTAAAKAVPAWENLDQYVNAAPLVRRPADEMRAHVEMDMAVRSIRVEQDHIAVGFILTLTNAGLKPATGLMVRIALGQGSAMHEAVLDRFYDGAGGSILRDDMELGAGRSEQLSSEVKLPRTSVEPMMLAGKPLLVPVLAADITYHWDGADDAFGQIAGAYVLGRAAVGGSEKLAPIPLDRAPLAVDRPGARATDMRRRQ